MNTKFGQSNLKPFVTFKLRRSRVFIEGRVRGGLKISMLRQETGSCYNSAIQCPICPKRHMFDKTPDLKRST